MSYAQGGVIELRFLPWNQKTQDAPLADNAYRESALPSSHVKELVDERQRSRGAINARVVGSSALEELRAQGKPGVWPHPRPHVRISKST
jgi:hypothetical protein